MAAFADWLDAQRRTLDLGVNEFANYLGIGQSMVSEYLNRTSLPGRKTSRKLCLRLNITPGELDALIESSTRVPPSLFGPSPSGVESPPNRRTLAELENWRGRGGEEYPVYQWGAAGDPRVKEGGPEPAFWTGLPSTLRGTVGRNVFGVEVVGRSMSNRGIEPGDVVWIDPDKPIHAGAVVLARIWVDGGETGMVIKVYGSTRNGIGLSSDGEEDAEPVLCERFQIIGPMVGKVRYDFS